MANYAVKQLTETIKRELLSRNLGVIKADFEPDMSGNDFKSGAIVFSAIYPPIMKGQWHLNPWIYSPVQNKKTNMVFRLPLENKNKNLKRLSELFQNDSNLRDICVKAESLVESISSIKYHIDDNEFNWGDKICLSSYYRKHDPLERNLRGLSLDNILQYSEDMFSILREFKIRLIDLRIDTDPPSDKSVFNNVTEDISKCIVSFIEATIPFYELFYNEDIGATSNSSNFVENTVTTQYVSLNSNNPIFDDEYINNVLSQMRKDNVICSQNNFIEHFLMKYQMISNLTLTDDDKKTLIERLMHLLKDL